MTNRNDETPCTLIYAPQTGFAMVKLGSEGFNLTTEAAPSSKYSTLCAAYVAALRAGHEPTCWRNRSSPTLLHIDQAAHWRSLMDRGVL